MSQKKPSKKTPIMRNISSLSTIASVSMTPKQGLSGDLWSSVGPEKEISSDSGPLDKTHQHLSLQKQNPERSSGNLDSNFSTEIEHIGDDTNGNEQNGENLEEEGSREGEHTNSKEDAVISAMLELDDYSDEQALLLGRLNVDAKPKSDVIRFYICMQHNDYKFAGKSLSEYVYPNIERMCKNHGYNFEVMCLYGDHLLPSPWLDGQQVIHCLARQMDDSIKTQARGIVMILSDDKKERIIGSLPSVIEIQDFHDMNERLSLSEVELLRAWYQQGEDKKADYILQPYSTILKSDKAVEMKQINENLTNIVYKSMTMMQMEKYKTSGNLTLLFEVEGSDQFF
ncbi:hypothetical protein ScPMuIL_001496 [Solemya velum]